MPMKFGRPEASISVLLLGMHSTRIHSVLDHHSCASFRESHLMSPTTSATCDFMHLRWG